MAMIKMMKEDMKKNFFYGKCASLFKGVFQLKPENFVRDIK